MFMHRIKLENILSFGPDAQELELRPLNVLIGPNGSGKSNLIEVIGLLRRQRQATCWCQIREGGGGDNWIWRGETKQRRKARVEVVVRRTIFRPLDTSSHCATLLPVRSLLSFGVPSFS